MNAFFSQLLKQSLTAGWVILFLLLLRPLLKKVPRWVLCLLWGLAAVRLAVPFSFKSSVSLVPQQIAAPTGRIHLTPIPMSPMAAPVPEAAAPVQSFSWEGVLPWLWLAGAAVMATYALYSYIRLARKVQASIRTEKDVYICDHLPSPFVLGIVRPRIYLPSDMEQSRVKLVLSHERAHLHRGDHLWKPLGFVLLSLHWFNPLCWAAYILFCQDMEQACDQRVVKDMAPGEKKAYSLALAEYSMKRSAIAACPLAFGEVGVKQRIQGILSYRKPGVWVLSLSILLCVILAAGFLTDPAEASKAESTAPDSQEAAVSETMMPSFYHGTEEQRSFTQPTTLYSNPSFGSQEVARAEAGESYSLIRREPIGDNIWGYVECSGGIFGWIVLEDETASPATSATLAPTIYIEKEEQRSFTQPTTIYTSPSFGSREFARAEAGESYTLLRREPIGDNIWGYVECNNGMTMGWILLEESETEPLRPEIKVYTSPSEDARTLCVLSPGEDYTILDRQPIGNTVWGYIECREGMTKGWIRLVEAPGAILTGTVIGPENVNVRSGPGLGYSLAGYLTPDTKVAIYEVVSVNDLQWGCLGGDSWVCMTYIRAEEPGSLDATEATLPTEAHDSGAERYPFSRETSIYPVPNENRQPAGQAAPGETGIITRREFINDGSWAYITLSGSQLQGWVHLIEEDEALNYFRDYVAAYSQPEPDEAEQYLYFASEYAREFFRDTYYPITGWNPSGIFRVNDRLWGIQFSDPDSGRMVYSFVGRLEDRLYVFQNVHGVPEALSENLDIAAYEEENAMYLSDGYMECYSIIKRLLPFANPTYVTVEDRGSKDYSDSAPYPIEDVICGTDTWRVVPEPASYGSPSCIITLTARDGSVATICDSSPVIVVSHPDGTQEWFQGWPSGEELVGMLYSWAKRIQWTPGE